MKLCLLVLLDPHDSGPCPGSRAAIPGIPKLTPCDDKGSEASGENLGQEQADIGGEKFVGVASLVECDFCERKSEVVKWGVWSH